MRLRHPPHEGKERVGCLSFFQGLDGVYGVENSAAPVLLRAKWRAIGAGEPERAKRSQRLSLARIFTPVRIIREEARETSPRGGNTGFRRFIKCQHAKCETIGTRVANSTREEKRSVRFPPPPCFLDTCYASFYLAFRSIGTCPLIR